MIRGATTAGLSKSLDDAKDTYERRLQATQKYFIWSVVALVVSVLPIAAQLIPGPWQAWMAPSAGGSVTDASPWLSTLGKFALLLPATWATAFFASNYAELFHLSREYAHKAALAKAIEGFKREAPDYEQEIVGSVFMEIQDNPRSRKASPVATPQNPIVKSFLKIVLEAIRGKQEEQK
jgi:di/tricarboxylate transporter